MAEKEFTLKVIKSEPTPRRRRVAPGANGDAMNRVSTGSQVSGSGNAGSAQGDGHVHANKGALDKIGVTDDGYVTVTDMPDAEAVTEKAKAGYADEAKTLTEDSEVWEMFVSRLKDDVVKGKISFERAIAVAGVATLAGGLKIGGYGIDKSGKATLAEVAATLMKATSAEAGRLKVTEAADIVLSLLRSADFVSGATGKGVAIYKNGSSWKMEIDELLVRKIATFLKLEIRELSYVGGNIVLSKAGNEITKVEKVSGGWKCSFTSNEEDEVQNFWKAGDQARCQKFDVAEGTNESVQSKYYWRLVTEVGEDYVVLSETDYDEGVTNSEPAAGDKIVQMGFRLSGDEGDKDRTSLIILSTSGENTPSIEAYTGITAYELGAEKRLFILSPGEVSFRSDMFRWMSGGVKFPQEVYRGDWESGTAYNYYDKVTHNGSTWICIAPDGTESEPAKGNAAWKEYAEKGADGTAGKGIKSITEYYLATSASSGVTTGTSGWTTSVQTITAAKRFLWNYEKVAYTDGTSSKSSPVIIGVYGEKGDTGTSVTVSSTTITYAAGTNGTTPPSSGWSEKVPAVSAGKYLWSKTVVTYSDGKSTTTYSVSYQGTNGSPGEPGTSVTITGQATKYAVTTTAGQPADSAFTSDKIPALSPGDYLWSRTIVTYSSGVQTKSYAVSRIGTDGTDGQPGSDGKNSYTHFAYANSANGETGFSTTYFEGALYLGTCSDFNEADPTDYRAYSWARMKGDTGAGYSPNLIIGTKEMDGWVFGHTTNVEYELVVEEDGGRHFKETLVAEAAGNVQCYVWLASPGVLDKLGKKPYELYVPGKEYTLSFDYKADTAVEVYVDARGTGVGNKYIIPKTVLPATAEWKHVSLSGTCPRGVDNAAYIRSLLNCCLDETQQTEDLPVGSTACFRKFCLVEGEGTQWVPAASEMVGVDGKGIKSITEYYLATSAGSGVTTGTSGWTTSVQTITATKKYLWNYEVTAYTDGSSTKSSPVVIGVYGDKGATGAKGDQGATGETLSGGKMMFADPTFKSGMNSIEKYSNGTAANKAKLLVERISTSGLTDVPTGSGYCIRVTCGAAQSPGHGGVCQGIASRAGAVFVQKIIAKIPSGYTLESISNQMGTGYKHEFLTSRAGTGKYETYLIKTTCGATGSFSSGGYIYINGGSTPTEASPLVWYIAYMTAFDLTADEEALSVTVDVEPGIIALKTESDGSVVYEGNTAKISAKCGSAAASVAYGGAGTLVKTGFSTLGTSVSGGVLTVTLSGVETVKKTAKMPDGKGGTTTKTIMLPVSGGSAVFDVTVTYKNRTETRRVTVPFTVDVKASMSEIVALQDGSVEQIWGSEGMYQQLATLKTTAGELKSTVESMPLGGPNLLPHSMWRAVVRSEAGNTWVKLKKGVKYTLSARACAEEGKDLFVSTYAVQSSGQWGRSNAIRFTEADFAEKSLTFVLEDKNGFTYNDEVRVLVYGVNVVKGTASATEGKGAVVWVQLEEGPAATTWQAQAGDYEERPSLLKADEWTHDKGVEDKEVKLADGTTGTAKYYKAPSTTYRNMVMNADAKNPLFAEPDTQYTVSVWAKGSGELRMYLRATQTLGCVSGEGVLTTDKDGTAVFELTDEWKRYEATVTTGATVTENAVYAARVMNGGEIWCYGWKVEKGGMATGGGGASLRYESEIQQLDKEINLSVKKDDLEVVGIHLDGEDSTIRLVAGKTVIEGGEFDANNATFKNIKVEGILSSVVSTTGYDNRNYFIGDDCIPGAPLNILVTKMNDNAAGTEQHLFLPCDYDFIGSHVMILADNISDSAGKINTQTLYTRIYAGRNYMKHAYLTQGQGTSAAPYKISQEMLAVDDSAYAGTGHMLRDTYQRVFSGAQFFGRWRSTAGTGTEGDDISGSYAPDRITIVSGYIEFVGVPAPTATAILFPYKVELQTDNSGAQTDDSNSHLLKVSYVSKTVHFPVAMSGGSPVQDELYNKLKGLYDEKGNDGLPTGVTALGLRFFQYYNPTTKSVGKEYMQLFRVPLCRWYPTSLSALTSTGERKSSVGNITSVEGAVYQS